MNGLCNHTPGPWVLSQIPRFSSSGEPLKTPIRVIAEEINLVAVVEGNPRANARLIAAAPALLAALFACITEDPGEVIAKGSARRRLQAITLTAQAAIVQATGGAPHERET